MFRISDKLLSKTALVFYISRWRWDFCLVMLILCSFFIFLSFLLSVLDLSIDCERLSFILVQSYSQSYPSYPIVATLPTREFSKPANYRLSIEIMLFEPLPSL